MKVKVSEATRIQLDWLVARALGKRPSLSILQRTGRLAKKHDYTTNWAQGGPIIEREGMHLDGPSRSVGDKTWYATHPASRAVESGPTILVAGLRAFVVSRMGREVEVPEELK